MFPNADGTPTSRPPRHALAVDGVRHLGVPVAFVVAKTAAAAQGAAEAVSIAPLQPVVGVKEALVEGAPQLHHDAPGIMALTWRYGDSAEVADAFASAAHVKWICLPRR